MADQPSGTVTLLFTDIEASTRLLQELGGERYADVLDRHRRCLRGAFARHNGFEVDCEEGFVLRRVRIGLRRGRCCRGGAGWARG
jgi:class 3 adenylate cyclase